MQEKVLDCVFALLFHSLHTSVTGGSCACPVFGLLRSAKLLGFLCVFFLQFLNNCKSLMPAHPLYLFSPHFRLCEELRLDAFWSFLPRLWSILLSNPRSPCQREQRSTFPVNIKVWKPGNLTLWIVHNAIVVSIVRHCCRICYSTLIWQARHVVQIVRRSIFDSLIIIAFSARGTSTQIVS